MGAIRLPSLVFGSKINEQRISDGCTFCLCFADLSVNCLFTLRRRKDVDYANNPNWTCAREHRYVVQCFQVNGTCTACSDQARPHRLFRLVFSPTFQRKFRERRRIGIVTLCYQSQDTRHFLWAEFVALAENYALKTISSAMIFSQAPSIHSNGDAKNRQKFYAIVVHGRDNSTTQFKRTLFLHCWQQKVDIVRVLFTLRTDSCQFDWFQGLMRWVKFSRTVQVIQAQPDEIRFHWCKIFECL